MTDTNKRQAFARDFSQTLGPTRLHQKRRLTGARERRVIRKSLKSTTDYM